MQKGSNMKLNNFKIKRLDKYNIIIEEYREVINPKTKERSEKWVDLGVYLTSVDLALSYIRNYIMKNALEESNDLKEFAKYVENYKVVLSQEEGENING